MLALFPGVSFVVLFPWPLPVGLADLHALLLVLGAGGGILDILLLPCLCVGGSFFVVMSAVSVVALCLSL